MKTPLVMQTLSIIARLLSVAFLALAVTLVAYGLYDLAHFARYAGEYYDERLILFDNGFYPLFWGIVLLLTGLIAGLRYCRPVTLFTVGTALVFFAWKCATVPAPVVGQSLFPDAELLNDLIVVCLVLLCLVFVDRLVRKLLSVAFRRLRR